MAESLIIHDGQNEELAVGLFDRGIIKFGDFTLKSGRKSPIYYNQRPLLSIDRHLKMDFRQQRRLASLAVEGYSEQVKASKNHHHLYGIPQAATAIGALVADNTDTSYLWGRIGKKDYGKHEAIEGDFSEGESVLQLDDVVTNADSKIVSATNLLQYAGLETIGFVVMFDRQEGGAQALSEAGYRFRSVINLSETVSYLAENNRIGKQQIEALQAYHEGLRDEGVESTFSYST